MQELPSNYAAHLISQEERFITKSEFHRHISDDAFRFPGEFYSRRNARKLKSRFHEERNNRTAISADPWAGESAPSTGKFYRECRLYFRIRGSISRISPQER